MIAQKNDYLTQLATPTFGLMISQFSPHLINSTTIGELKNLLYLHKFLIFKNINFSLEEYIAFAKAFGKLVNYVDENYRHPQYPEVFIVSNEINPENKLRSTRVGHYWHSDSSFLKEPLPITMLYSQIIPKNGGETAFIDMSAAYLKLKHLLPSNLSAIHEGKWRYFVNDHDVGYSIDEILEQVERVVPPQKHPLIIKHPITQLESLYISQGIVKKIDGLSDEESKILIDTLWDNIKKHAASYKHIWQTNEIVVWDNRSVIHRAYPALNSEPRLLFRIGLRDRSFF